MSHFAAPSGFLITAKWQGGIEYVVTVNPDGAGFQFSRNAVSLGNVTAPNTGSQTIVGLVGARNDLIQFGEGFSHHDWSKDFFPNDAHSGFDVLDDRRLDEVSPITRALASDEIASAVLFALVHVAS